MNFSIFLFLSFLAFVNCDDVSNISLGSARFEFKKRAHLGEPQPELPQDPTSDVQQRNLVTDRIKAVIESLRDDVDDPLVTDHIGPIEYFATGTRVAANLWNLQSVGQSWYLVDQVSFNPIRLALGVHMTLPWLSVTGIYDANARILLINHNAGGNFRAFVHRMELGVDLRLGTNIFGGGHLTLRELDIKIDIHDINIQIDGLVGSNILNSMINSFVQNMSQDFIQNELGNLSKSLGDEMFDVINELLKEYRLEDLLGI